MKKSKKLFIFIFLIIASFFFKTNNIKAEDCSMTCNYPEEKNIIIYCDGTYKPNFDIIPAPKTIDIRTCPTIYYNASNGAGLYHYAFESNNSVGSLKVSKTTQTNDYKNYIQNFNPENGAFNFCSRSGVLRVFKLAGTVLDIIKILIPVLLIIIGSYTFTMAIISGEEKDMKNSINALVKKIIAGIVIFFIPTITSAILNLINNFEDPQKALSNKKCQECFKNGKDCDDYIQNAERYESYSE